ncbi:MAG: hypothetical protein LBK28_01275 [Propionibacteriaceae bacterium]|jgi:hypothetical protein|nr:hypothetical protein [Propionibacteriaceae bacterium]
MTLIRNPQNPVMTNPATPGRRAIKPVVKPGGQALASQRKKGNTPALLRRLRAVVAGLMIVLGVSTVVLGNAAAAETDLKASSGVQAIRMTTMSTHLLHADQTAAEYLIATENQLAANQQKYLAELRTALENTDELVFNAAADPSTDRGWLVDINAMVSRYERDLERAVSDRDLSYLNTANKTLQDDILPRLEESTFAAIAQANSPRGYQFTIPGISWVAALVLLALCVPVAKTSHRVLNVGLLTSAVAALVIAVWSSVTLTIGPWDYQPIYNAGKARSVVASAQLADLRAARLGATGADYTDELKQWDECVDQAQSLLYEDLLYEDDDVLQLLTVYTGNHAQLVKEMQQKNWDTVRSTLLTDEKDGALRSSVRSFDQAVLRIQNERLAEVRSVADANRNSLLVLSSLATLLTLGGLIGGIWGLNRRLKEYE